MNSRDGADAPRGQSLTPREEEILTLIGEGQSNRQIAETLTLAQSTVKWYVRQIYNKLGIYDREEAVRLAREMGLVSQLEIAPGGIRSYEIHERLGAGRYGVVYRAFQTAVGREVAIKTILPQLANRPDFIRRFEFEARLVARLEHPNIVPLYDYWRDPSGAYLVMRWLRGGSLRDEIAGGPLSVETTTGLIEQIASALNFAHEQNVVHQDIRPANILLDEEHNAYVADFGIGFLVEQPETPEPLENDHDYRLSSPVEYSSPEQLRGTPPTTLSDIYHLGLVLYEMLSGRHPYADLPPKEIRRRQLIEPLPLIHEQRPDVPPAVDEVIQKATNKDPALRFQNAPAFCASFAEAVSGDKERLPAAVSAAEAKAVNPYKGLRSFVEADADDFFGREKLVQSLLDKLAGNDKGDILAVVGPSGSGKSSVVRAGLIPALRAGALPGSEDWFFIQMHPGRQPFEELEAALLRVAINPPESLMGLLREDNRGLHRALLRCLPDENGNLFLLIDQFEELFTLVEEEATRQKFLDTLVEAVRDSDGRLTLVFTLRADYYDRPLKYPQFGHLIGGHTETVLPLSAAELEEAIVQPAQEAGAYFEEGLAARIVDDVRDQPGALPLLQYALTELYENRDGRVLTHDAYEKIGGVTGALAQRAEALYLAQSPQEQEALRQVFLRLVAGEEDMAGAAGGMRRRESLEALLALFPEEDQLRENINSYAAARLLTLDYDPLTRAPTVEVAHEALIEKWQRLREWLAESKDDRYQQQRLNNLAKEWYAQDRDPGLLLRETRLDQLGAWAQESSLLLTAEEEEYLALSLAARRERLAEEEARRQQELENARQLAETERKRAEEQSAAAQRLRRRAFFLIGALALAGILAAAAILSYREAQNNFALATSREAEAQNVALIAGSQAALANDDTDTALALAWQAVTLNPDSALAQAQLSEAAYAPGTVRRFLGHEDWIYAADISPDGQKALSGSADKTVRYWDLETGETLWVGKAHENAVNDVAISPDGRTGASVSDEATIIWDLASGEIMRKQDGHEAFISHVAFSPDGQHLVTGGWGDNPSIVLWDATSGEIIDRFPAGSSVAEMMYTPDGSAILTIGFEDGILRMIDSESGEIIREMDAGLGTEAGTLVALDVSSDGRRAITGYENSDVLLWDLTTGELLQRYEVSSGAKTVAIHPQNDTALVGGTSSVITNLDLRTGRILNTFNGHTADVGAGEIVISADGQTAVSASLDQTLRLWDLDRGNVTRHLAGPSSLTFEADLSPDGRSALRGSTDGTVTLFDVESGQISHELMVDQPVMSVTFSPDGQTALIGSGYRFAQKVEPGHIILWDVSTGEEIRRLEGQPYVVFDVEFTADGKQAVSSGNGPIVLLWDVESGQEIRRFEDLFVDVNAGGESFWDVAISPDGRTILAPYSKGPIIEWDAETGELINEFEGHDGIGSPGITFNKDGTKAVTGSFDTQAILWDVATGDIIRRFTNHAGSLGQVTFSPDERQLLGGSDDGTSSLWDIETGDELRRYGNGWVMRFDFTPDGSQALAGYRDGTLEMWRIDSTLGELLSWTENNRYIRDLTCEERALYNVEPLCELEE
jgi:WD40 repeat protein/serine/threonine protein kinase